MTRTGRTGLWLVGAGGSVASTVVAGLAAMRVGAAGPGGVVTETSAFAGAGLVDTADLVTGGHDVHEVSLTKRVEDLATAGVVPHDLARLVAADLDAASERVRPGYAVGAEDQGAAVRRLAEDLRDFREREGLDRVVVVNVSSTEPPVDAAEVPADVAALEAAWSRGEAPLPPSSVYAAAAFTAGCAFVDFTPSTGARLPVLGELAARAGLPWGGSDGKTGETLLKSVLAPMFAQRALRVHSWSGTNLLGGGDGATLARPDAFESKARSKAAGVGAMLGYPVEGPIHIDNVADLGDWKTAWDHITFSGFLGTRMTLQFTWQGCDSALAAPLVVDLARLLDLAMQREESGAVPALGFFFKDPVGSDEHALAAQYDALLRWVRGEGWTGR
ncbi:inositol-3-phosphate synthase [Phycicoccus sp. BSK3Z-2]|uniref:Inositol-3-phosphate synthase n=1 Tax=Phycicoccus avicenniae TaxID=2828860 RepID=A0A941D5W1_9MICO|nr:inositol-3-phosphate synthase [Phycicoccus avicenniae]MBR7742016.1 inositol-3-phosphate synthase [Phycicoccus avicenniae]